MPKSCFRLSLRSRFRASSIFGLRLTLFAALCGTPLCGQGVILSGNLVGRVTDPTGAALPAAAVVIESLNTGIHQQSLASRTGLYRFPSLAPGSYSLTASSSGFTSVTSLVQVLVGNTTSQDLRLGVGSSHVTVSIDATTPMLRQADSSASTVLERTFLEELPLSGRRYTDMSLLTPNTSSDGDTGLVSIAGQQGGEDSGYANGNGSGSFTVDGTNATSNYFADILGRYRIPYLYGENAIQEFQVSVSPYSALFGGGAGFVNTVTRSGTNSFHGNLFYYNRNAATGANDAISKSAGFARSDDSLHQFGGSIGGPIRRHSLWFFADYEQQRESNPISVINPTIAQITETDFGIPAGTPLPAPNSPYPVPGSDSTPDPNNPVYLQQVSNVLNSLASNLGTAPRHKDDSAGLGRLDLQASERDSLFLSTNINRFDSPGGIITVSPVAVYGKQSLADAEVHDEQASFGWTHTFSPHLLNELHAGASEDNEIATPTGLVPDSLPTFLLEAPAFFTLGNASFSTGRVYEQQTSVSDRVDLLLGRHTLQFGADFNRAWDADRYFGGADPNADVQFGSFRGSYVFTNLQSFALGEYSSFTQAAGNPNFAFGVPATGFYLQDSYQALAHFTIDMGLREDFQVYPQPKANPAFPLTGQFPNQRVRLAPRLGFAWSPNPKTVVRGGFGQFYTNFNGLNYRNAVVSNGLPSQQASVSAAYNPDLAPNQQAAGQIGGNLYGPAFPNNISNPALFQALPDISLVSPQLKVPNILEASLQVEFEIASSTTLTLGTMWNHGVHLFAGSAYDLNLQPLQGRTTYVVCPKDTTTLPCSGRSISLPTMDSGLLTEGRINPNLGQINALISPGQNQYNSLFFQLQRRSSHGLALQASYTFAKSLMRDGMDFNNQFDLSNAHGPSLLDQRHRLTAAAVYQPHLERLTRARAGRTLLSNWTLSNVLELSSGRPYSALLSPACTSASAAGAVDDLFNNCSGANGNLNDSAVNQDTANTASGINGAGPTPGIGLNSFYGPWIERLDGALARTFPLSERLSLKLEAQGFNLFNHANYYVQNGEGINSLQYNPIGTNCGDGTSINQQCYLVPNSGPDNFKALEEISPNGRPRVLQFSARLTF